MIPQQRAKELLKRLTTTCEWTLRGGNDPDDHGNITQAVDEIAQILCEVIDELTDHFPE